MSGAGIGFAAAGLPVEAGELARVYERDGSTFAVIAEASGGPFERVARGLSRAMLDAAEGAAGGVNEAAAAARGVIAAAGGAGDDEGAEGWLVMAQLFERRIAVRWAGLGEAWLVEGGAITQHARGHSTRYQGLAIGQEFAMRGLGASWKGFDAVLWRAQPGARLVLASASVARLGGEVVRATVAAGDAGGAAQALVDAAIAKDAGRYAVAIVVEVG